MVGGYLLECCRWQTVWLTSHLLNLLTSDIYMSQSKLPGEPHILQRNLTVSSCSASVSCSMRLIYDMILCSFLSWCKMSTKSSFNAEALRNYTSVVSIDWLFLWDRFSWQLHREKIITSEDLYCQKRDIGSKDVVLVSQETGQHGQMFVTDRPWTTFIGNIFS